jgi:V/A-type H+-transporting ATPase subunit I
MAIDRMKKVTLVCRAGAANRLLKALHKLSVVELTDTRGEFGDEVCGNLAAVSPSTAIAQEHLQQINHCLAFITATLPEKKSLLENVTPLPLVVEESELKNIVETFDLEQTYSTVTILEDERRTVDRTLSEIQTKTTELEPFERLPYSISDLQRPSRFRCRIGEMPAEQLLAFVKDPVASRDFAVEAVPEPSELRDGFTPGVAISALDPSSGPIRVLIVHLAKDDEQARTVLGKFGFQESALPRVPGVVRDRLRELQGDRDAALQEKAALQRKIEKLEAYRRPLRVLLAFWSSNLAQENACGLAVAGKWSHVFTGYCRAADIAAVEGLLERSFADSVLTVEDPGPNDSVPVSIRLPLLLRPIEMLIHLFGLPKYTSFDPSPFIIFNFFLFFGICFGDVGYGIMLTALGLYLAKKTPDFRGLNNFSRIFIYAGVSTTIFGALTGSWFGDLWQPQYLGENNFLLKLKDACMVLDLMADPVTALVIALGIGMVSQLYGVGLKMYGAVKARDWPTAVYDCLLWIVALPGLIVLVASAFGPVPGRVVTIGLVLFLAGAAGLVLTQGRNEATFTGKAITGVVSLYGILGTYGCTAFIGDVLSYCRLLALGLTTGIVASSFNMMAGMLKDIPYVGLPLFILALVGGHAFNFLISVLGAFVHSMRLIFVEMFGRFYETGGRAFSPLGFNTKHAILKKAQ